MRRGMKRHSLWRLIQMQTLQDVIQVGFIPCKRIYYFPNNISVLTFNSLFVLHKAGQAKLIDRSFHRAILFFQFAV